MLDWITTLTYMVHGLIAKEMEKLCVDIEMHVDFDMVTPTYIEYWEILSFFDS